MEAINMAMRMRIRKIPGLVKDTFVLTFAEGWLIGG
jgi:hypothetical protein